MVAYRIARKHARTASIDVRTSVMESPMVGTFTILVSNFGRVALAILRTTTAPSLRIDADLEMFPSKINRCCVSMSTEQRADVGTAAIWVPQRRIPQRAVVAVAARDAIVRNMEEQT
jgi:hypothetical protein